MLSQTPIHEFLESRLVHLAVPEGGDESSERSVNMALSSWADDLRTIAIGVHASKGDGGCGVCGHPSPGPPPSKRGPVGPQGEGEESGGMGIRPSVGEAGVAPG